MMRLLVSLSLLVIAASCQVEPSEIYYGEDACHFCKMTIVDRQHAAQVVTVKGKAFKYDAIECMMNDLKQWDRPEVKFYLANDYANPGELIDAREASFLISEGIPSPMGEFLSAFSEGQDRSEALTEHGGTALNWDQLRKEFQVHH